MTQLAADSAVKGLLILMESISVATGLANSILTIWVNQILTQRAMLITCVSYIHLRYTFWHQHSLVFLNWNVSKGGIQRFSSNKSICRVNLRCLIYMIKVIQPFQFFPQSILHFSDKPFSQTTIYRWFKKPEDAVSGAPSKSLRVGEDRKSR